MGGQRIDHLAHVTVEHLRESVCREANPVVGHTVLRKVVGANLLRPFTAPDLRPAVLRDLVLLSFYLDLVESSPQHLHRLSLCS